MTDHNTPQPDDDRYLDPQDRQSLGRWLLEMVVLFAVAFLLAQGVKTWVVQPYVIPSGSMIPAIAIGDHVLVNKFVYDFSPPQRGDVVILDDPTGETPMLIKRVIGVAGERVDVHDGSVYINGVKLVEPYTYGKPSLPGPYPLPTVVPNGYVWVMGDNRTNSQDSRWIGPQPVSAIHGKAFFTYWPLDRAGTYELSGTAAALP
jgi:signal peptidase I